MLDGLDTTPPGRAATSIDWLRLNIVRAMPTGVTQRRTSRYSTSICPPTSRSTRLRGWRNTWPASFQPTVKRQERLVHARRRVRGIGRGCSPQCRFVEPGTAHGILGFLVMLIVVTVTPNCSTKGPPGKYPQDQFAHGYRSDKVTQLRREKFTACLQIRCWVR